VTQRFRFWAVQKITEQRPSSRLYLLNRVGLGISSGILATCLQLFSWVPGAGAIETDAPVWQELPRNTALAVAINTNQESWATLDQFRVFQLLEETLGIVPNPGGLPYLPYGMNYQTSIQPWVGNQAVIALLPARGGQPARLADHLVMLAPITDEAAFADYFQLLLDRQPDPPEIEQLRQTDIYFWPKYPLQPDAGDSNGAGLSPTTLGFAQTVNLPLQVTVPKALPEGDRIFDLDIPLPVPQPVSTGWAIAVLPDTLIAAETPAAIKTFLSYRQGSQGQLANRPEFQRTLAHPQQPQALVMVYGNALELLNYQAPALEFAPSGLPIPDASPAPTLVNTLRNLNFGGTLEALVYPIEQGLQLQGRFYYDALPVTLGLTPRVPTADTVLEQLPASTYLLLSGRDLAGIWRQVTSAVELLGREMATGLDQLRNGFTALTGLDLDRDIFGWMDQDLAFAAFPADQTPFQTFSPRLQLGVGLLIQTRDRPTATHTLNTADELLTHLGFGVTTETVNTQPVTSWTLESDWDSLSDASPQSLISHGWVTDDTVAIVSGPGAMERVMNPSPDDPLRSFPLFQNAVRPFPETNNGYFYMNFGAMLSLVYQVFDLHGEPTVEAAKPFLSSFRTLSATTAQTADYIELDVLLGLAPREVAPSLRQPR
jgi:hypothetical protein